MDKLDIFNLISKLTATKNTDNLLNTALNALTPNSTATKKQPEKPKYSNDAILSLLKRHDQISKQIDRDNKR